MQLQEIKDEVAKAYATNKKLKIEGYIDSKGHKHNYVVRLLGFDTGYKALVQRSLEMLPEVTLDGVQGLPDKALWEEEAAKNELLVSFKKSLAGKHTPRVLSDPPIPTEEGYCVYKSEVRKELIAVVSLQAIEHEMVTKVDTHPRASQPCVVARAKLRELLPISQYVHSLILGEGKVDKVTAL